MRGRRRLHCATRRILQKERALVRKFWGNCPYNNKGFFFLVKLSNSFDLEESAVLGIFKIAEFEFVLRFEVVPFLLSSGPIFARIWP